MPPFDGKPVTEMASKTEGDQMMGKRGGSGGVQRAKYDPGGLHGGSGAISCSGVDECAEQSQRVVVSEQKRKLTPPPPPPVSVRGIGGMGHGHVVSRATRLVPPWKTDRGEGDGNLGDHQSLLQTDEHSATDDINFRDNQSPSQTEGQSATDELSCVAPSPGLLTTPLDIGSRDSVTLSQTLSMEVWSVPSVPSDRGGDILSDSESSDNSSPPSIAQDCLTMPHGGSAHIWVDSLRRDSDYQHPSLDPLCKAALLARELSVPSSKRFGGLRTAGSSVAATHGTNSDRFAGESDDVSTVTEEGVTSSVEMSAGRNGVEPEYEELEALDGLWSHSNTQGDGCTNLASRPFHYTHFHDHGREKNLSSSDGHLETCGGHAVKSLDRGAPSPPTGNDHDHGREKNWSSSDGYLETCGGHAVKSLDRGAPSPPTGNDHDHGREKNWSSSDGYLETCGGHAVKSLDRGAPSPPTGNDLLPGPPNNLFGGVDDTIDDWGMETAANIVESHNERIGRGDSSFMPTEGPSGEELFYSSQQPCSPFTESDITPLELPPVQESNEVLDALPAQLFVDSSYPGEFPPPPPPVGNDVKGKMPPAAVVIKEDESNAACVNDGGAVPIDFNVLTQNFTHLEVCNPGGGSIGVSHTTTEKSAHFSNLPCLPSFPTQPHRESGLPPAPPPPVGDMHGLSSHLKQPDDEEKMRQQSIYSSNVQPFDGPTIPVFGAKPVAQSQVSGVPSSPPPPPEDRVVGQHGTTVGIKFSRARNLPVPAYLPPDHGAAPHTDAAVACPPPHTYNPPGAEDELYQRHHAAPVSTSVNVSAEDAFSSAPPLSSSVPPPPPYSIGAVGAVSEEKKEGSISTRAASPPAHPIPSSPPNVASVKVSPENGGDSAASATSLYVNNGGMFGSILPQAVSPQPYGNDRIASSLDSNPSHVATPFSTKSSVSVEPPPQQAKSSSVQHLAQNSSSHTYDPGSHLLGSITFENVAAVHDHGRGSSAADVLGAPPAGFYNAFDLPSGAEPEPVETPSTEVIGGPPDGMFSASTPSDELSPSSYVKPVEAASNPNDFSSPPPVMFDTSPTNSHCPSLFNSSQSSTPDVLSPVYNNSPATAMVRPPPPASNDNQIFNTVRAVTPVDAYSQAGGHGPAESRVVTAHISHFDEAPSDMAASDAAHQEVVIPQFGRHPPGPSMFQAPPCPSAAEVSAGATATEVQAQNHPASPQYPSTFSSPTPLSEEPAYSRAPHPIPADSALPRILRTIPNTTTSEVLISQPKIMFGAAAATAAATASSVPMMGKAKAQGHHHHQIGRPSHAAVVSLGFGGRLVIVQPYSRTAKIWNVRDVTTLSRDITRNVEEFPGPAEVSRLTEILHFCEMKAAGRNGEGESERLIWGSVLISLKYSSEGKRVSASQENGDGSNAAMEKELAALLKESQLRSTAGMRTFLSDGGDGTTTPEREAVKAKYSKTNEWGGEINGDLFQALESHLIEGQCDKAVQLAFLQRQWGLGLLIALRDKGSKSFQTAARECVSNCIPPGYSSLGTTVLSLAGLDMNEGGAGPQELLNSWKLVASSYLTTQMDDYQGKLVNLGDDLLMRALIEKESGLDEQCRYCKALTQAAHTLYIMAGLAPQKPGKQSRMVLPGVDFSDPGLRSFRSSESWDAMHLLEVLEIIHGSELTPVVLGHKLRLAMALADIGWLELAEAYTNRVRGTVNSLAKSKKERGNVKTIPYTDKFVEALSNFEERVNLALGKSPPAALGEGGAGRWLLKKMTDIVVKSSSMAPQSESKYQPQQQQQQPYGPLEIGGVDLPAGANLPGSSAAVSHQNNGATTIHQPFSHGSPYHQHQPSNERAVTSEAQPMRLQYGSPFAKGQQTSTPQPQVLFHPYASNSTPSQQQGQYNAAGSSVAAQSEEPSLPQSQLQHPAPMFRPFAQDPAMQQPQGQTTQHSEQPLEHQQQHSQSPHPMAFNSNVYTPATMQQKGHLGGHSQDAQQPVNALGQPNELEATITTNQSSTTEHLNSGNRDFGGMVKSAPTSTQTTPLFKDVKHFVSVACSPRDIVSKPSGASGNAKKSAGFLSGLVQKLTKVVHPEATVADIGQDMQAYWDDNTQKWVFPTAPEGDSAGAEMTNQKPEETAPISNALAALMAPPPVQAFGAGRVGAANHSGFTNANQNEPPPPSRSGPSPVCWTPPPTTGT
eukprot:126100_1